MNTSAERPPGETFWSSLLRPSLKKVSVAAVVPLGYLCIAMSVLTSDDRNTDFSKGMASAVITFPASLVPSLFGSRYQFGVAGFQLLAVLNALGCLVLSYIAIHVWMLLEAKLSQGTSMSKVAQTRPLKAKSSHGTPTSKWAQSHPLAIPVIVGLVPGYYAGQFGFDSTMGSTGPIGAMFTFLITTFVVTTLVGIPVYWMLRRI